MTGPAGRRGAPASAPGGSGGPGGPGNADVRAHAHGHGGPAGTPGGGAAGRASGGDVVVEPVRGRRDLSRFLRLPWRIYAGDPAWVPPLLMEQRALLDRRKHPFHAHADVEYFLARRAGRVAGRIVAGINHRHNEFHAESAGFFGFFESEDDGDVARALLATAEAWTAARGATVIRGPMNFSSNEEWGTLVEGFRHPPAIMMPHNPPYYPALLEAAGYGTAKDLLAYLLDDPALPARLARAMDRLGQRHGITIRPVEMRRFREEVGRIKEIYNTAWERNWGFVPMTDAEFEHLAKQLRPVVDPRVCLIAEVDGRAVGFLLGLPDYNIAIRHANGRLFPFGLLKILWHRRSIDRIRVLTLGVVPGYRRLGIDAMLYSRVWVDGTAVGYSGAECSWILEDNLEMCRAMERMGGRPYKTYRIYEKLLGASRDHAEPSPGDA